MTESKLPRGSFFYISVGPTFYGGRRPITEQVREHHTVMSTRFELWGRSHLRGWQPHKPHCQPILMGGGRYHSKSQEVTVHTGAFEDIMVSTLEEAKQFRRRSQAQTVLEHLTRTHARLGVVPRMGLVERKTS